LRATVVPIALPALALACAAALADVTLTSVPDVEPPQALALDDIDAPATIDDVVRVIPELDEPLGADFPVFIWGAPEAAGRDALEVERLLQARGLCVPPNIGLADEEGLDAAAAIIRFRHEQGWAAAVLCQSWGQVHFGPKRAPAHEPPAEQDPKRYPCIARYEELIPRARARAEADLDALVERGVAPDLLLMDWEAWYRKVWQADPAGLEDVLAQARACPVCSERLPAEYLDSPAGLLRGLELIRGDITRRAFVEPVKERFPEAHVGNYFCSSHVRSDEPLDECHRIVGWYGSGLDCSQPSAYGRYWTYHRDPEFVGWNVLWKYLGEFSHMARHQVGDEYQLPWSARLLTYQPEEPFEARGVQVWAWPRESYREYLRHVMLRGARSLCVFKPNKQSEGNRLMYLTELQDVLGVFGEMRRFAEILRVGEPLNLADPPGEPYSAEGAVVWSGMATDQQAVLRAVSFTGQAETVQIDVFGESITLEAPPAGRTYEITR